MSKQLPDRKNINSTKVLDSVPRRHTSSTVDCNGVLFLCISPSDHSLYSGQPLAAVNSSSMAIVPTSRPANRKRTDRCLYCHHRARTEIVPNALRCRTRRSQRHCRNAARIRPTAQPYSQRHDPNDMMDASFYKAARSLAQVQHCGSKRLPPPLASRSRYPEHRMSGRT